VYDKAQQPALKLARVDGVLSWWSVVLREPRFDSIEIDRPDLNIRRDKAGAIWVAGIELNDRSAGGGLSDWLLRQDQMAIRDAAISWHDELRDAPELALQHVDFRFQNDGRNHRFGLRAVPPETLATPLDVRGNFTGTSVSDLTEWNGQVFAQLDYTDIAAWRSWLEFPVYFPHGAGALRAWLVLNKGELSEVIADVQLSQVTTRLGKDLPQLDLEALKGRVGWKLLSNGFEVTTTKLGMSTHAHTIQPVDFVMRYVAPTENKPPHGELQVNVLEVDHSLCLPTTCLSSPSCAKNLMRSVRAAPFTTW
jgi:uncharacterized protein YhdP